MQLPLIAAVTAAFLTSTAAFAGLKDSGEVLINGLQASGDLGFVRNTSDGVQSIGCTVQAVVNNNPTGECFARDAFGHEVRCVASDPSMLAVMRSLKMDSFLSFTIVSLPNTMRCGSITVSSRSKSAPKRP